MNPEPGLKNAYTDAPELHPSLILGGLQLLGWLFFHPSAWHSHVARVGPNLRPDFCLSELSRAQWRNPALRRLLAAAYILWPLLAGPLLGLTLWALGRPGKAITSGVIGGVVSSVAVSVALGLAVSVALGVLSGVVGGMAFGLVFGLAAGIEGSLAVIMGGGVAGSVANALVTYGANSSFGQQKGNAVGGILVGTVLVGLTLGVVGGVAIGILGGAAHSVAIGLTFGLAFGWRTRNWHRGATVALMVGLTFGIADRAVAGVAFGATSIALVTLLYVLTERITNPWAAAVASALGGSGGWIGLLIASSHAPLWPVLPVGLISILLGLTITWSRPVLFYPFLVAWNLLLYRADERRGIEHLSLLRWHSAFWDELQLLPWFGLSEHLVLVMEHDPVEGQAALEYLSTSRQRWAARATQIELDARQLERCADVISIGLAHRRLAAGDLSGPASALLRSFSRVSLDVAAALNQASAYNQRLALSAVEDRLDGLVRELTRSNERYAVRFQPIATHWRRVVAGHVHNLAEEAELRREIDNPYIIGIPLTEQQEIFVGRTDISAHIEQLLLDRRRPPLLLYGQRRTGKTSLLNNLGRLLPSTVIPLFVDLQGPASLASDYTGFLYNIARGMITSADRQRNLALPPLSREALVNDPFTRFDEWLDQVEHLLGQNTALLALDEFEVLDRAIAEGHFDQEAVLGTLRHLIQHRPCFKVLLAGSHTLDELQRWASYLINVQVVHVSYLKESEARQLVERPVKGFALRYEPDASQRVLDLTRSHPFLVQLLCGEIVALKNDHPPIIRRLACLADVEAAVPKALSSGRFFFADIEHNQVDADGVAILRCLAMRGEGGTARPGTLVRHLVRPAELGRTLNSLIRRELVEPVGDGYRHQVELIRRWFAQGDR